jgi:hypothetical protein
MGRRFSIAPKIKQKDSRMPNWVENSLRIIKGDPKEVFEFVRTEESVFDFNRIVPMPEHIQDCDEEVDLHGFKVPTWRAWSVENWGTKWNAYDARFSTKDPEHTVEFDTAWAPLVALFKSPAKQFPTHEIVIHSDEYGNHFHRSFTLMGGQVRVQKTRVHCFEGNTEPLCVVNSMLWNSRKRRRSNRAATVGDESALEFLDPSPLPVGTGRGRRLSVFPMSASH